MADGTAEETGFALGDGTLMIVAPGVGFIAGSGGIGFDEAEGRIESVTDNGGRQCGVADPQLA